MPNEIGGAGRPGPAINANFHDAPLGRFQGRTVQVENPDMPRVPQKTIFQRIGSAISRLLDSIAPDDARVGSRNRHALKDASKAAGDLLGTLIQPQNNDTLEDFQKFAMRLHQHSGQVTDEARDKVIESRLAVHIDRLSPHELGALRAGVGRAAGDADDNLSVEQRDVLQAASDLIDARIDALTRDAKANVESSFQGLMIAFEAQLPHRIAPALEHLLQAMDAEMNLLNALGLDNVEGGDGTFSYTADTLEALFDQYLDGNQSKLMKMYDQLTTDDMLSLYFAMQMVGHEETRIPGATGSRFMSIARLQENLRNLLEQRAGIPDDVALHNRREVAELTPDARVALNVMGGHLDEREQLFRPIHTVENQTMGQEWEDWFTDLQTRDYQGSDVTVRYVSNDVEYPISSQFIRDTSRSLGHPGCVTLGTNEGRTNITDLTPQNVVDTLSDTFGGDAKLAEVVSQSMNQSVSSSLEFAVAHPNHTILKDQDGNRLLAQDAHNQVTTYHAEPTGDGRALIEVTLSANYTMVLDGEPDSPGFMQPKFEYSGQGQAPHSVSMKLTYIVDRDGQVTDVDTNASYAFYGD